MLAHVILIRLIIQFALEVQVLQAIKPSMIAVQPYLCYGPKRSSITMNSIEWMLFCCIIIYSCTVWTHQIVE